MTNEKSREEKNAAYFASRTSESENRIPKNQRSVDPAVVFFGFCAFILLGLATLSWIYPPQDWAEVWFLLCLGMACLALAGYLHIVSKRPADEVKVVAAAQMSTDELLDLWYIRYPLSVALTGLAWLSWVVSQSDMTPQSIPVFLLTHPVSGVMFALLAAVAARELVAVVLVLALVLLVFSWISSMSVSLAIVIGACVIGGCIVYALRRR